MLPHIIHATTKKRCQWWQDIQQPGTMLQCVIYNIKLEQ
jgi:hypothetical protein